MNFSPFWVLFVVSVRYLHAFSIFNEFFSRLFPHRLAPFFSVSANRYFSQTSRSPALVLELVFRRVFFRVLEFLYSFPVFYRLFLVHVKSTSFIVAAATGFVI